MAERAADQAIELGHDAQAVRLLEDVLRHAHLDIEQRGRLAVKLGCAMYETLQPAHELIDLLRGALASNLPPVVRGELRYWLAVALEHAGSDPTELRQLEMEAVNDLDERPDLKARVMLDLGIPMAPGIPLPEHKMWLRRALDALPDVSDPAFAVFVRGKSAMALVTAGDPAWRELVDRLIDDTNGAPRRRLEVHAYLSVGAVASYVGHYRTCARLLESSLAAAQAMQSRRLELHIRSAGVVLDYCRGSWTGLDDTLQQLLDELADYAPARVDLEAVAGCLALAHGRLDEARSRLTAARSGAHDMASLDMEAFIVQALGRLAVVSGDVQSEVAELDRLLAAIESKQYWAPLVRALPVATQLLSAAGQKSRVRDLVRQVAREWKHLDIPLATAALRHAKGYLAEAAQQWPGAAQHFQAAVDRYRRLECPYEETQAREQAAAALLRAGNARGEETLRAALAGYRQLGASWDEARCTRVARGFGIRIPVPHRGGRKGYGDQLSPREKEVVRLAAVGCSNKQIADELFLSPATVGSHLARAMSKLGVHSRVALATHIPDALKTHAFAATQQPRGRSG